MDTEKKKCNACESKTQMMYEKNWSKIKKQKIFQFRSIKYRANINQSWQKPDFKNWKNFNGSNRN